LLPLKTYGIYIGKTENPPICNRALVGKKANSKVLKNLKKFLEKNTGFFFGEIFGGGGGFSPGGGGKNFLIEKYFFFFNFFI
jgi:hypothetical protein